jgi:hypothetical protein
VADGVGDGADTWPGDGVGEDVSGGDGPGAMPKDGIKWFCVAGGWGWRSAAGDGEAVKGVSLVSGELKAVCPVDAGGVE